jgi:hypothetical protein
MSDPTGLHAIIIFAGLLIGIGSLAFICDLTSDRDFPDEINRDWFCEHERVLWESMEKVASDRKNGRYK